MFSSHPNAKRRVTIQAQFLNLLKDIQQQSNLSTIVVTHDLGIIAKVCEWVAVMYAGKIVETANTREIFNNPAHPYTVALMNSLPDMEAKVDRLYSIEGQPPELHNLPPGCSFAPRCPHAMEICREQYPPVSMVKDGHYVSCWLRIDE